MKTIKMILFCGLLCMLQNQIIAQCNFSLAINVLQYPYCPGGSNGVIIANLVGIQSTVSYLWSNGTTITSMGGLPVSSNPLAYQVWVSDTSGCTLHASILLGNYEVKMQCNGTSCNTCSDGAAFATPTSTSPPFSYLWSNSSTMQNINSLDTGTYTVTITDAMGCIGYGEIIIATDTLEGEICGNVFIDVDSNGVFNAANGDYYQTFTPIYVLPSNYTTFTDSLGNYCVEVDSGITYTVYVDSSCFNITTGNATYTITPNNTIMMGNDFGLHQYCWIFRYFAYPGYPRCFKQSAFDYVGWYTPEYKFNVNYKVTVPPITPILGFTTITPSQIIGDTLMFNYTQNLNSKAVNIGVNVNMPGSGNLIYSYREVTLTDTLGNLLYFDSLSTIDTVKCSYDPNDITAIPQGTGAQHITTPNIPLQYTIRFQNTGNDTAYRVIVIDTLDAGADLSTFQLLHTSHACKPLLEANGKLTFTFNNIMLPDSNVDEPESHGMIIYKVKPKSNLTLPYNLTNTAYIYFDQNLPVQTNTAFNLLSYNTNSLGEQNASGINIFPNPSDGIFHLKMSLANATITVYDIFGRALGNQVLSQNKIDLTKYGPGIYYLELLSANNKEVFRLMKQ